MELTWVMCGMKIPAVLVVFLCCKVFHVCGAVDIHALLWPLPTSITSLGDDVRALDPANFMFITDLNSDLLNKALERYKGILFQTPVPFYPDGAPQQVKAEMSRLTVKVSGSDETLKPDVDESCEVTSSTSVALVTSNLFPTRSAQHEDRNAGSKDCIWFPERYATCADCVMIM